MDKQEFLTQFEQEVLMAESGTVLFETRLEELPEWDSMAIVATLAMLDGMYDVKVNAEELKKCKTVNDIIALIKDN